MPDPYEAPIESASSPSEAPPSTPPSVAIAAFALVVALIGLAGLVLFLILGNPIFRLLAAATWIGLVVGLVALFAIKKSPLRYGGKRMALTATLLSGGVVLLAATAYLQGTRAKAAEEKRKDGYRDARAETEAQVQRIKEALTEHYIDKRAFPKDLEELKTSGYLQTVPTNGQGNPFTYEFIPPHGYGRHGDVRLYSVTDEVGSDKDPKLYGGLSGSLDGDEIAKDVDYAFVKDKLAGPTLEFLKQNKRFPKSFQEVKDAGLIDALPMNFDGKPFQMKSRSSSFEIFSERIGHFTHLIQPKDLSKPPRFKR